MKLILSHWISVLIMSNTLLVETAFAKLIRRKMVNGGILQPEDEQALLDIHNEYRSKTALGKTGFQPMAKDMTKLTWDDQLATDAKTWANNCEFRHERNIAQGENLYTAASSRDNVDTLDKLLEGMQAFYDEHVDYRYHDGSCVKNICGHYTQVVWAESLRVGCGYAECTDIFHSGRMPYQILMVCRYSPQGNWIGNKPYQRANRMEAVASICPDGYIGNASSGLCELLSTSTIVEEEEEEQDANQVDFEQNEYEEQPPNLNSNETPSKNQNLFRPTPSTNTHYHSQPSTNTNYHSQPSNTHYHYQHSNTHYNYQHSNTHYHYQTFGNQGNVNTPAHIPASSSSYSFEEESSETSHANTTVQLFRPVTSPTAPTSKSTSTTTSTKNKSQKVH